MNEGEEPAHTYPPFRASQPIDEDSHPFTQYWDHGWTHPFTPIDAGPPQIYEWPTLDHSGPDQVSWMSWVRT